MTTHRPQPEPQPYGYGHHQPPQYAPPAPAPVNKARRWPWIVGIVAAFIFGNMSGQAAGGDAATTSTSASVPAVQPAEAPSNAAPDTAPDTSGGAIEVGTIPAGSWLVPGEVAPGQYRSTGVEEGLIEYCQVTTYDEGGDVLEWKNIGQAGAPLLVTVSSNAVTVTNSGCATFTKVG